MIDPTIAGVFGIPLETLIERHGADSMLGAGPGSVRVPMFIDDVITAMKQMGECESGTVTVTRVWASAFPTDTVHHARVTQYRPLRGGHL